MSESQVAFETTPGLQEYTDFEKMETTDVSGNPIYISDHLLQGIWGYGWEKPSFIQQRGIVPIMTGKDVIIQAQSGTGKTGTYSIGMLSRVDPKLKKVQGMIILNTKELANQVLTVINALSAKMGISANRFMGNIEISEDVRNIRSGCQVVVGTPGRICDLLNKGILNLDHLRTLIIDEADTLLSKGFRQNIEQICKALPKTNCNIAIISATMPDQILEITTLFMIEPIKILVQTDKVQVDAILQFYVKLKNDEWKFATLCDFYEKINKTQSIIFVNSTHRCQKLTDDLRDRGYAVTCLYGNMKMEDRVKIMDDFRRGNSKILITTDLLARGIDIQSLGLVINYDLPPLNERENYIHRIGRAGRFGKHGCAISFVTQDDENKFNELVKHFSLNIKSLPKDYSKYI